MEQLSSPRPSAIDDSTAASPSIVCYPPRKQSPPEARLEVGSSNKVSLNVLDKLIRRTSEATSHSAMKAQNEALQYEIDKLKSELEFERQQAYVDEGYWEQTSKALQEVVAEQKETIRQLLSARGGYLPHQAHLTHDRALSNDIRHTGSVTTSMPSDSMRHAGSVTMSMPSDNMRHTGSVAMLMPSDSLQHHGTNVWYPD